MTPTKPKMLFRRHSSCWREGRVHPETAVVKRWLYGVAYKVAAGCAAGHGNGRQHETSGVDLASVAASIDPRPFGPAAAAASRGSASTGQISESYRPLLSGRQDAQGGGACCCVGRLAPSRPDWRRRRPAAFGPDPARRHGIGRDDGDGVGGASSDRIGETDGCDDSGRDAVRGRRDRRGQTSYGASDRALSRGVANHAADQSENRGGDRIGNGNARRRRRRLACVSYTGGGTATYHLSPRRTTNPTTTRTPSRGHGKLPEWKWAVRKHR